jgi:hypothetical protein
MSIEKIKELGLILVLQPPYFPDLAPCDFFLFGYLKQHLEEKHLTREDEMIAAVGEVFDKILLQTVQNVMDAMVGEAIRCVWRMTAESVGRDGWWIGEAIEEIWGICDGQ